MNFGKSCSPETKAAVRHGGNGFESVVQSLDQPDNNYVSIERFLIETLAEA